MTTMLKAARYRNVRRPHESGFTLVELMVASLIFIAAIGVLLSFVASNERARNASYHVLEARQNARSLLEFMVSEIRMAGSGTTLPVVTSTQMGGTVTFYPVNPDTVAGEPSRLTILGKFEEVETTLQSAMLDAGSAMMVSSTDGFEAGDLVVVTDGTDANLFEVTAVPEGTGELQHSATSPYNIEGGHTIWPSGGYDVGSRVYKADLITYYLERSDSSPPAVMRKAGQQEPRVMAEHIEALELSYELQDHTIETMPGDLSLIRKVHVVIEASSEENPERHSTRLVSAAKPRCL